MPKTAFIFLFAAATIPNDQLPDSTAIVCVEEKGGWCESSGNCYNNTMPPITYVYQMARLPYESESTEAISKECRNKLCGKEFLTNIKKKNNDYMIISESGFTRINEVSMFFTHISYIFAIDISRVLHAFGKCNIRKGIAEK